MPSPCPWGGAARPGVCILLIDPQSRHSGPNCPVHQRPLIKTSITPELHRDIRALARERNAVILAHNYERPEVQDVGDYVGD